MPRSVGECHGLQVAPPQVTQDSQQQSRHLLAPLREPLVHPPRRCSQNRHPHRHRVQRVQRPYHVSSAQNTRKIVHIHRERLRAWRGIIAHRSYCVCNVCIKLGVVDRWAGTRRMGRSLRKSIAGCNFVSQCLGAHASGAVRAEDGASSASSMLSSGKGVAGARAFARGL